VTLPAILAWLSSFAGGVVVKLVVDGLTAWMAQRQADTNAKEVGRVTAERDQEAAAREATERELAAAQAAPQSVDDAIARLEEGSA
jgi:hypothetical protein